MKVGRIWAECLLWKNNKSHGWSQAKSHVQNGKPWHPHRLPQCWHLVNALGIPNCSLAPWPSVQARSLMASKLPAPESLGAQKCFEVETCSNHQLQKCQSKAHLAMSALPIKVFSAQRGEPPLQLLGIQALQGQATRLQKSLHIARNLTGAGPVMLLTA